MQGLLLFGGSFDPIHHGHLIVSRHVAEVLNVEQVVLIPSAQPPHKQDRALATVMQRLELCRLAVEGDSLYQVSDWEARQAGPNYSLHTVEHFREEVGADVELYWLIGMDSLVELGTWYRAPELVEACTIVTAARPGYQPPPGDELGDLFSVEQIEKLRAHVVSGPQIDISASHIRGRVQAGWSIRYLVPDRVAEAIAQAGLYRS